jgi:hypothetical protein
MAAMGDNGEQEKLLAQDVPIITLMMSVTQQRRAADVDCNGKSQVAGCTGNWWADWQETRRGRV